MRIHVAQEIPAGAGPLGHGVSLAHGGAAAAWAGGVDPVGHLGEGAFAVVSRLITLDLRQHDGQLLLRNGDPAALRAADEGDRLAPVALTGEYPVAQLIIDLLLAEALLHNVFLHRGDGLFNGHAVEGTGIDHDGAVVLCDEGFLGHVAAGDDLDYRQAELGGKLPVALVVPRNAHDDTGAVAHEDVVGDEDWQILVSYGVYGLDAVEPDAGLVLVQLAALKIGLAGGLGLIGLNVAPVGDMRLPLLEQRVLGRDDHIGRTEQGVGTGGVNGDFVADVGLEGYLRTGRTADPVALLDLDALNVIDIVQIVEQALGVGGYLQHPLALLLADDRSTAALAHAVNDLFVCKHALAAGAPVDGHGGLVGKAILEHLEEYPLRPLIILRVGGIDGAIPVEAVAQHLELAGEVCDIVLGDYCRVDVVLDSVVLGRQAESVKADREQDIIALHALFARDDVHRGEGARMADMQSLTGGVRELDKAVELGLIAAGDGGIGLGLFPSCLPFLFYRCKIVFHFDQSLFNL